MRMLRSSILLTMALGAVAALAQSNWQPGHTGIGFAQPHGGQQVQMVSPPDLMVNAGAHPHGQQDLTLRFAIQTGLHINSHTPHSAYLIPTTLTLEPTEGVEIAKIAYPPGADYRFKFSPQEALSVYAGEFSVLAPVRAQPGHYTLHGQLHYQACDNNSCDPPRILQVTLDVTAR